MKTHKRTLLSVQAVLLGVLACTLVQTTSPPTGPVPATIPLVVTKPVTNPPPSGGVVNPTDLEYVGAFRLPGGEDRPQTFAYGGNAMTFNPDGDSSGAQDGFPGSLFVMGHDRIPYGELPDGNQVAEINIPVPVNSKDLGSLNTADFVQGFNNIAENQFVGLDEIPRVGMLYLNRPETGPKIHIAWGQHFQESPTASHGWFSPTLSQPNMQGAWFIGEQDLYSVNGYMFEIPAPWAEALNGKYIATGRARDGGWSGMGPALFAYTPWQADGSPPPDGTHLQETVLLLYENSYNTEQITHSLNNYQHPDEWEGGAWITAPSGKQAVIFAGTKSNSEKYWYGYLNPDGPQYTCVDTNITDFPTCRMADGSVCLQQDFEGCCDEASGTCASLRGWWGTRFDAQIIFYDPVDLAKVASGAMTSWEPQPYAFLDLDEHLYLSPPEWERISLGWGDQRRYRIGDVAYDRGNNLLYVLELFADGAKPVVHVWRIR
jgi:hypothetical protein